MTVNPVVRSSATGWERRPSPRYEPSPDTSLIALVRSNAPTTPRGAEFGRGQLVDVIC